MLSLAPQARLPPLNCAAEFTFSLQGQAKLNAVRFQHLDLVKAGVGKVRPLAFPFSIYAIRLFFADAASRSSQGVAGLGRPGRKGNEVRSFARLPRNFLVAFVHFFFVFAGTLSQLALGHECWLLGAFQAGITPCIVL